MAPLRIIGLVFAALVVLAGPVFAEPRVALVIGNSNYGGDLGQLPNPANDARLMAKTLRDIGFTVVEAEDADQTQMKRAIQDFSAQLAAVGGGATGLFFYAGHGLQVGGTNYLIPIHAKIAREGDVELEAVSVDLVMKQMAFADSAVNIVILDACRNNPLSRGFRAVTRGLADPSVRPMGSFIAYSTAPGDVAEDGKGANSPYTTALATAITRPGAGINDVFQEVRGKVLTATNQKQVPWDSSSLTAPFYFVPAAVTSPPGTAVDPQAMDLAFWNAVKDSKSPEDYQAYLDKFPDGVFASLAKLRLKPADQAASRVVHASPEVGPPPAQSDASAFETAFWNAAKDDQSPDSYQAYLNKYPNGRFADQARQQIAALNGAAAATPKPPLPEIVATTAKLYARDKARLRDAPATAGAVLTQLSAGTPLDATGRSADGAWWRVNLSDGRSGFVAAAVVDTQAPPPAAATPPPPNPVAAPDPETTATVPAGKERDICLEGADQPSAVRAVACRRLLAAGIPDETDRYNAELRFGDALSTLGKSDEAMQAYRKATQIDPNFFGAYSSIGALHLDAGRYAEARAAFEKAVALNPDDANSRYQRGTALADLGEFDAARVDVARAIEMKSDEVAYYDQLAAIDLAKGDATAAVADVERGVAVSQDYWGGAAILAYYLVGKFDRTIAMAEAGQKSDPAYPYFTIWKALAQRASGDKIGAIDTLNAGRAAIGTSDWPAPLMDYLAGRISESKLRALAASNNPKVHSERLCEINFYSGELAYIAGDEAAARTALRAAVDSRIFHYLELVAAKARLAQLQ
jgi:carboxyl-terminal processing protease